MGMIDDYKKAETLARDSEETLKSVTPLAVFGAYEGLKEAGLVRLEKLKDDSDRQAFKDAVKSGVLKGISGYYQVGKKGFVDDVRARHAMWGAVGYVPEQLSEFTDLLKDQFSYEALMAIIGRGTRYAEATALDKSMPRSVLKTDDAGKADVVAYCAERGIKYDPSELKGLEEMVKAIELAEQKGLTASLE